MTRYAPLLCLMAIVGLAGCRSIADQKWPIACEQPAHPASGVRVIQIDEGTSEEDPGEFFDATDLDSLKTWLESGENAPIVAYVHGWHNNATEAKPNLRAFRTFIAELEADICQVALAKRDGSPCPAVQGVFVGWRGDSLDPWIFPDILDFWTFDGRSLASIRVGEGDLREVLAVVAAFTDRDVFIAGHSLGAMAIYHALMPLEDLDVAERHNYFLLNPAITSDEFIQAARKLSLPMPGDAPATPRTDAELSEWIKDRKHRKVLLMQSDRDFVIRRIFGSAYGLPIGFDDSRHTHEAKAPPIEDCPEFRATPAEINCEATLESGLTFHLAPGYKGGCKAAFAESVWIVSAHRSVSSGHGDIWGPVQRCALAELISKRVNRIPGY